MSSAVDGGSTPPDSTIGDTYMTIDEVKVRLSGATMAAVGRNAWEARKTAKPEFEQYGENVIIIIGTVRLLAEQDAVGRIVFREL